MRTRSSSNIPGESSPNPSSSNPKRRNRRHSKKPFILEESPVDTIADKRTMAELLRAPTKGYAEAIVVPLILAEQFELKHSLFNMMTSDQFFRLEKDNPHDHIRWFNKIASTIKYKDVPNSAIKLMLIPFSLVGAASVILKKLLEKLRDPGKYFIPCGFSELKCKALADLGASINLMPLSVWKKLGLPELISTCMTLELANRAIYTPAGIARDVFVSVGKFTFPSDFVIVDYESDLRVPLILGRPFLWTARALIDVHGEEMILCDSDERLTLNMRHDTSSYSNQPQKESINMINILNDSSEDFFEDLFARNHLSGNLTFSSHSDLTSSEVKDDIFDPDKGNVLIEKLLNLDSTKELPPPHNINPSSDGTTSFSPNHLLKEFADEIALITFLPGNDELPIDIESDLKEVEYFLNHDPIKDMDSILKDSIDQSNLADLNDNLVDTMPEMFTDEHALDYSSPPLYDEYDDDLFEVESDIEYVYDDPFDSKEDEIKESKLLIDELDPLRSSDFLVSPEYDSFLFEDFSRLTLFLQPTTRKTYLIRFSSKNEEKVFKPGILTSKGVHSSLLPKLSHRDPKVFRIIKILESPMEIFPCSSGEDIRILDVWISRILKTRARGFVLRSPDLHILSFILGIQLPNLIE
nr:reverse transcriptase domain-containing protein [Tanacetum cinerariifolium]